MHKGKRILWGKQENILFNTLTVHHHSYTWRQFHLMCLFWDCGGTWKAFELWIEWNKNLDQVLNLKFSVSFFYSLKNKTLETAALLSLTYDLS